MYMYYYAPKTNAPMEILSMALEQANEMGCDVFNALNIMGNTETFEELKFGSGDGYLNYYFYNYAVRDYSPKDLGMILV
jgi:glycylpeptide N-tetradecanoyltransferase